MNLPPLLLGRLQFTVCISFLALFLAVILALAWVLLFFKVRARVTGNPAWTSAYRFWVRIFALSFVLALASAVPLLFLFGTVWSGLLDKIGNVAGPLLGFAVLSVFAVKSCFVGVMLFGQRRVSETVHTLSVFMVALGQMIAAFWVLALLSWMQTPDGAVAVDGRYEVHDWMAVVFNPSLGWTLGMTLLGSALTVSFLIMGITAWQALRRPLNEGERLGFKTALWLACCAAVLLVPVGMGTGRMIAHYQPAKAAAAAAYWHQDDAPDAVLFAWPDERTATNLASIAIGGAGARWLGRGVDGKFEALENFSGMQPPVALTFWSLRAMLALFGLMFVVAWLVCLKLRRRGMDPSFLSPGWLRLISGMTFAGAAAVVAGWWLTVVGLQPYAVNGAITQTEILGPASAQSLLYGTLGYLALYGVLFAAFVGMLFHAARYGVVPVRKATRVLP